MKIEGCNEIIFYFIVLDFSACRLSPLWLPGPQIYALVLSVISINIYYGYPEVIKYDLKGFCCHCGLKF
jgi:hypothetical protein